jgi:signal transduction histidine kinase
MRLLDRLRALVSSSRGVPGPPSVRLHNRVDSLHRRLLRRALPAGVRLPRYTVRLRLTLMYGCVFLVCGAGLLTITYLLVRGSGSSMLYIKSARGVGVIAAQKVSPENVEGIEGVEAGGGPGPRPGPQVRLQLPNGARVTPSPQQVEELHKHGEALMLQARSQHKAELNNLLGESGIALAIMAVVSMGLGWLLAGRVLRPLQTITGKARAISASNLHERLALVGPDDELRELGDTFDELLARLDAAFQSQRQFVANASHELRTPLTVERALLEVALANPDASEQSLRHACERVLASSEEQERLLEALLTLASSERGLERREPFNLGAVAAEVVRVTREEADLRGLRVDCAIDHTPTAGDPRLAERLVRNLIDNALRHNVPGGHVEIATTAGAGRATLTVANSGAAIPPQEIERLLRPFERLGGRADHGEGHGLGLSIVQAIAIAHGATLTAGAQSQGGLRVEVGFPLVETHTESHVAVRIPPTASAQDRRDVALPASSV